MHRVLGWIVDVDRLEGAGSHLQVQPRDQDAFGREGVEQLGGEVESRCRRGDAALGPRVDGLVALLVGRGRVARDVGREGEPAEAADRLFRRGADEARRGGGRRPAPRASRRRRRRPSAMRLPGCSALPGFPSAIQPPVRRRMDQQHLGRRPRRPGAEQPSVPHASGVEDDQVARGDERGELREPGVGQDAASDGMALAGRHPGGADDPRHGGRGRGSDAPRRAGRVPRRSARSARSTISSRLPARSASGSWAMSSGGRS